MLDGLSVCWRTRHIGAPRWFPLFLALLLTLPPQSIIPVQAIALVNTAAPTATTITVDTSSDLDSGSLTKTCTYTAGIYVAATDGCTLRRAILEAAARPQADRPIAIQFNLAANDPNKDKEVVGTWTLPIAATLLPLKTDTILNKNGQVTLDGDTQPGGRTTGPKIIIDTNDNSLQVESTNNLIRNLAFKGGGVLFLKEDNNTVERIWMGLSDDGQSVVFRTPANPLRMAGGGIHISSNNNTVQNNVIAGAFACAIDIDGGDNNLITRNLIGTRADGTVPTVTITINPASATIPVDYTIKATDAATQTLTSNSRAIVATYTWPTGGTKTLAVTVKNELGTVSASHQIALTGGSSGAPKLYLPLVRK